MPTVRVEWYPGRSQLTKDVLSRRVLEAFAHGADCPYQTVQIVFSEIAQADWVLGPSVVPGGVTQSGEAVPEATYSAWLDLSVDAGRRDALAAWYRDELVPDLVTVPGFLGVDLYELTEADHRLCVRWVGEAATERCFGQQPSDEGVWARLRTFAHDLSWQRGVHRKA